jgi:homospermidine synthase
MQSPGASGALVAGRDTQGTATARQPGTFVDTWSVARIPGSSSVSAPSDPAEKMPLANGLTRR